MKKTLALVAFAGIAAVTNADVLANWTFETSLPATAGPHAAEVGSGSASGFHASSAAVYSNPSGNGSNESFSSNNWSTGDYYQFSVDTSGYENISFGWSQIRSGTGPADFKLEYSIDGGGSFSTVMNYSVLGGGSDFWSSSSVHVTSIYAPVTISGADDAGVVLFRLTSLVSAASAGTNRVDDITVAGDVVPAPGALALVGLSGLVIGRRRR